MFRGDRAIRRVVGGAVLWPLLVFALSFAHDLMRCRVTGVVIQACACPDDQLPTAPALEVQSCCERDSVQALSAAREQEPSPSSALLATTLFSTPIKGILAPASSRVPPNARTFHPPGPPLVLVKNSFLI